MIEYLQKECVTQEQAKKLKDIGFDGIYAFGYYDEDGEIRLNSAHHTNISFPDISDDIVVAPTYQHAFRWIREKFGLHHITMMNQYYIERMFTYEVSLSRCLDDLITIIKETKAHDV